MCMLVKSRNGCRMTEQSRRLLSQKTSNMAGDVGPACKMVSHGYLPIVDGLYYYFKVTRCCTVEELYYRGHVTYIKVQGKALQDIRQCCTRLFYFSDSEADKLLRSAKIVALSKLLSIFVRSNVFLAQLSGTLLRHVLLIVRRFNLVCQTSFSEAFNQAEV